MLIYRLLLWNSVIKKGILFHIFAQWKITLLYVLLFFSTYADKSSAIESNDLDESHNQYSIFPNPANEFINISISPSNKNNSELQFYLVNVLGQIIVQQNIKGINDQIPIFDVTSGTYMACILAEKRIIFSYPITVIR